MNPDDALYLYRQWLEQNKKPDIPAVTPAMIAANNRYQMAANEAKSNIDITPWLRANPNAVFQSAISGLNRPMQNWFGSRFGNYYNRYLGDIANEGNQGLEFTDWIKRINFLQDYLGNSPYQRGMYQNQYAPRTRFLTY